MLDKKLLSILVCPLCKSTLHFDQNSAELICYADALAYPIRDGIPVMLDTEARALSSEEKANRKG
jgi:uncharacterized protein YbaR (Trm112 family)